jgi:hypothetical protein
MRGFKEDFESWRSSLTPEEQELVQTQAVGEFNKKFRKSDEFKKDLPEEKVKSFSKILGKFFDAESADYKKEVAAKVPNYNRLLEKAGDKVLDFEMKNRIVEVDRDADRRYNFATRKAKWLKSKGEHVPPMSPLMEMASMKNDDAESHEQVKKLFATIPELSAAQKAELNDHWVQLLREKGITEAKTSEMAQQLSKVEGLTEAEKTKLLNLFKGIEMPTVPAMGEDVVFEFPKQFAQQLDTARAELKPRAEALAKGLKEHLPELKELAEAAEQGKLDNVELESAALQSAWEEIAGKLAKEYVDAVDEVETMVEASKKFYRSQTADKYKTKADVMKSIWAELPKIVKKDLPPLDEELLAELEEVPAVREGEFRHNWGTADMLYKSEAIDAFGMKYLLGVFETEEEARKAFLDWNSEYVKARADMKSEMQQWSKQENARLEADTSGADRIRKILEEARR